MTTTLVQKLGKTTKIFQRGETDTQEGKQNVISRYGIYHLAEEDFVEEWGHDCDELAGTTETVGAPWTQKT